MWCLEYSAVQGQRPKWEKGECHLGRFVILVVSMRQSRSGSLRSFGMERRRELSARL
ncbi:hypothetical protein DOTSEDRAFT_72408 [Dothistroma septosporum NZE10]|uniref:Uncharacterized protein n=1 Tax=Dothistroma septosporum (strain NZE10 / CBS 128990) TaxID=675120 RepID=M2YLU4_DOTSN|nr:hypothetical protein DOTSEDRAFT_72408 [Dothistroma septosporum NZE10]